MRAVLYLLTRLHDEDVEWLAAAGERKALSAGTVLFRQGEPTDALTFILDGAISVILNGTDEAARLVGGDLLGEILRVGESSYPIMATIVEPALVLSISRAMLNRKIEKDRAFKSRLVAAIVTLRSAGRNSAGKRRRRPTPQKELDMELMENIHLAGARFDRLLKKLTTA